MKRLVNRLLGIVVTSVLVGVWMTPPAVFAASPTDKPAEPSRKVSEWNLGKDKLAIEGYDPVAYFPEGGGVATKGDASFATEYGGAVYRFASAAHRDAFLANPARYEPAYGGWCAWAMLDGDKVSVDPKSFLVKDDRLFVFYKGFLGDTRAKWLRADPATEAKTADAMWKKISGE